MSRATALGNLREWARNEVKRGKPVSTTYVALSTSMHTVIQEFLTEHEMVGVRYWLHPESDSYFLTPPGEKIGVGIDAEMCIELTRYEFLGRQGLHFDYLDNEL